MTSDLRAMAEALQTTSRVLSAKGIQSQAQQQEAVSMLLGMCMLDDQADCLAVESLSAPELTRRAAACDKAVLALALAESGQHVLMDAKTGICAVMVRVHDATDWECLPVHLQNFVSEKEMPAHLVIAVREMVLEGDSAKRYYALPVSAVQTLAADASIKTKFVFSDVNLARQYAQAKEETHAAAAREMEPFFRLQFTHLISMAEAKYERAGA